MTLKLNKDIEYWKESSEKDLKAAKSLFEKRLYPQCLFFCHLTLEKMLKSLLIQRTGKHAPYIHDLRRLAELAGFNLSKENSDALETIFTFNIAGRYPEEKFAFYKKYNKREYAGKYLKITRGLLIWLKEEYKKK